MANKIFIYRFSSTGTVNMRAAEALKPFYAAYPSQAIICRTPFGMMTNMVSDSSAREVYDALIDANIGDQFMVIEVDNNDTPIVVLMSTGEITMGQTPTETINHAAIDRNKTPAQLDAEFDTLLGKVHEGGMASLSPAEKARLEHLSQR